MKRHFLTLIIALLAIVGWALVALQSRQPQPPARIVTRTIDPDATAFSLAAPGMDGAAIGFCLLGPDGTPIHESPLARTALAPASALKAVTTATALAILGPDFRFRTTLHSTAPPDATGTIQGDLLLTAGGDPTLTTENLQEMAKNLAAQGVKSITGTLRVDATIFPHDPTSEHWNWGDIGNAYGTGAFGINLDHNVMTVRLQPGSEPSSPTTLTRHSPTLPDLTFYNHTTTGTPGSGDGVVVYSEPYGRRITLRGTVPPGPEFTLRAAFPDPPALADFTLRQAFAKNGIRFGETPPTTPPSAQTHELVVHQSAPLPEIIAHCHRVSDNLEAQCLFLMIGHTTGQNPIHFIQNHWKSQGVDFTAWRLLDGSGLARANMIRPLDLARILHHARTGPHGEQFYETLNSSRDGNVRSKLGAMSGVRSDAGFIRLPDGTTLTFALIANGLPPQANLWALRDHLITTILESPIPK